MFKVYVRRSDNLVVGWHPGYDVRAGRLRQANVITPYGADDIEAHPVAALPDPLAPGVYAYTPADGLTVADPAALADLDAARLPALRTDAEAAVDAAAEAARAAIVTPGSGQAMSYLAKEAEARRVLAGAAASALLEPLVGVEVDPVTGDPLPDLASVAAVIVAQADAWMAVEGQIDAARRGAKIAIAAAADAAGIEAARDAGLSALQAV